MSYISRRFVAIVMLGGRARWSASSVLTPVQMSMSAKLAMRTSHASNVTYAHAANRVCHPVIHFVGIYASSEPYRRLPTATADPLALYKYFHQARRTRTKQNHIIVQRFSSLLCCSCIVLFATPDWHDIISRSKQNVNDFTGEFSGLFSIDSLTRYA